MTSGGRSWALKEELATTERVMMDNPDRNRKNSFFIMRSRLLASF
jgi:hypothetical protein